MPLMVSWSRPAGGEEHREVGASPSKGPTAQSDRCLRPPRHPLVRLPARTSQSPPGNPMDRRTPLVFAAALGTFHLALPETAHAQAQVLDRLSHILVIYMENRSFDNIFGEFPGANGIGQAGESAVQRDRDDKRYEELPVVKGPFHVRANPDELYNAPDIADLPNRPFPIV